jgi:hypothetical protein
MASLGSPTAIGLSEDEFDRRATILTDEVIPKAGQAVGDAKASAGALPVALKVPSGATIEGVDAVNAAADNINTAMQNMTGHQFSAYGEAEPSSVSIQNYPEGASTQGTGLGEESGISQLPGRSVDLSKAEKTQLENLSAQLEKLRNSPTVTTASDVLTNINTDIGKWDNPQFGSGNSPVQGVLKYSYGQIKAIVAEADPALSAANSTYHDLMNLKSQIANQAGQTGQSSALLMRRVLSGDKSNSVVPLLQKLDAVTAPFRNGDATSLVQQAILADWSTSLFGDETTRQLLSKAVSQGNRMAYAETSIFGYPRVFMNNLVKGAMAALSPDPAAYAMSIAKGEDFSLNPLARYIDNQMNKTTSIPIIGAFTQQLKNWGVSANNAESSAKVLFKMFLLQQLTRQNGTSNPSQGGPFTLPVNNTISYPPSSQSASSSPLSMANANQTASAIRSLTPPQTGQAMGRTLGVSTPGKLSMSSSLS